MGTNLKYVGKSIAHVLESLDYRRLKHSITLDNVLELVEDYEHLPSTLFDEKYYETTSIPTIDELVNHTEVFTKVESKNNKTIYINNITKDYIVETHKANRLHDFYRYEFQRNNQEELDYVGYSKNSIFDLP